MNQDKLWLIISVAVLVVLATGWVLKRVKLHHARNWPVGEGQVDATEVRLLDSGVNSKFIAVVQYSYTVGDTGYRGRLERSFLIQDSADKWTASYPRQRSLVVRYNPRNARDSVLLEREQTR